MIFQLNKLDQKYYNKYIKYKTKYLQLAGNYKTPDNILELPYCTNDELGPFIDLPECELNNMWKNNYIELYNILLTTISDIIKSKLILTDNHPIIRRIKSLCSLLIDNLTSVYVSLSPKNRRTITINMRFIMNIVSILFSNITNLIDKTFSSVISNVNFKSFI